ncbi:carbamoyl-phosphate synthase small subunit [Brenneria populi]|uniref:Carbamoyl-phosphate synthase small subunit n=1 Tax=Brenneria populi TaxID=1505588 RepID=A0ABU6JX42_9GAMM|nr:carbamoyl-phosphate synthase small subunit [Brenneria populi Li et al. 2015]
MSYINTLILDAGFSAGPIIHAAVDLGAIVGVCSGKAGDPGHQIAHRSFVMDYSQIDRVMSLARQENISALLPGVTDVSYLSGAYVAAHLGLPGFDAPDTADILFKKDRFRRYAKRQGLPIPHAVTSLHQAGELRFPVLVKPADAYSGRGIVMVEDAASMETAYHAALAESTSGEVVIEEFKRGRLHSHSAFVRDGRIVCEFYVDEFCTVYPYQVNSSCLSAQMSESLKNQVSECIQHIITDLQLCDGLVHTQFIASGEDFWLIELTRRCPGDLYSLLIQYATGVPYAAWFAAPFLGHDLPIAEKRPPIARFIARHTVSSAEDTTYFSLRCQHEECRIIAAVPLKKCGESLQAAPFDRAAILFSEFADETLMLRHTPSLKNHFTINSRLTERLP